jgi:hypothetical protein
MTERHGNLKATHLLKGGNSVSESVAGRPVQRSDAI